MVVFKVAMETNLDVIRDGPLFFLRGVGGVMSENKLIPGSRSAIAHQKNVTHNQKVRKLSPKK